jgi:hypothetical protein
METETIKADLEAIVAGKPVEQNGSIIQSMQRLDSISKSQKVPGQLRHYLERRSYVKALEFLNDPSTPHHI